MLRLVTLFALLATVINEVRSLDFDLVTAKAPWSARASPQLTRAESAFTYTYNGVQQTAPANSFLIYGSSDFRSNDVWLSTNKGITWIPIAGNGTSYASFTPTKGAASTTIGNTHFRISGERANGQECLKTVFQSTNGQAWTSRTDAAWVARMWASTIVDSDKNLYLVGGRSCGAANSLNDIWKLPNEGSTWTRVTDTIPFGGPRNAVAGSAYNEPLRRDVFYHFSGWSGNQDWNDVYVSSDKGVSWNRITANAPWRKRDDATGFVLPNGVLVLVGGKSNADPDVYHNDIWVSLNGGYNWGQCNEDAAFTDRRYSTTTMDENGYLYVAAGESNEGTSELMNDVWKSRISFFDTAALVRECNVKMPRCGKVGLSCWPGAGTVPTDDEVQCPLCGTEGEYLNFVQQTARAAWAARAFANMESFPKKLKYTPVGSSFEIEIAKGALVMQGSGKRDENDVWVSTNYGRTWALIAGISRYGAGGVVNAAGGHALTSFATPGPFATSYGFDEKYGYMYRIGGEQTANQCYRTVYNSNDGVRWNVANPGGGNTFQPLRRYASAATDSQGQVYITGGTSCGGDEVYNDVWKSADRGRSWVRQTDKSPWEPRLVHMLLGHKGNRAMQSQDILWVLGGWSSKLDFNDVWASTDQGKTWDLITLSANWPRRDDFNAEVTKDGLLIISGGKQANPDGSDNELFNDVWVSADGGYTWGECVKDALFSDRRYQMTLVDDAGYFIIAGGQEVVNGQERLLNDVWRSSISFNDLPRVAKSCSIKIPQCGVGLSCLPGMDGFKRLPGNCGVTCLACPNTCTTGSALDFVRQAINAPWSARSGGSMEQINKAITYTNVAGNTIQVPSGAIVLHGESGRRENDVWITTNQGQTWQLIAGISRFGRSGEMKAGGGHDMTSFQPTADPAYTMDSKYNLYRIGGANNTDTFPCADAVWMSTNGGVTWQNQYLQQGANLKRRITPPRQFAGAIWGTDGAIYVTGGRECNKYKGMNDVWRSTDQGKNWILMTDRAPWAGRLVHQMLSIPASQTRLGKEILVIMSGWLGEPERDMNDVWASSDHGRTWAQITGAAKWPSRDDANAEVTARGLLVLTSGKTEKPYTIHNDVFVSADGGYTWGECIRDAAFSDRRYQMTMFDNDDYLYVAGGNSDEGAALNDVWRSTLPFSDVQVITSLCGISIPTCGIGLNCWPESAGFRILDNNRGATCNLCQNKPDNPDDPSGGDDDYSDTSSSSSTGAAGGAGDAPKIGTTTLIIIFAAIAVILLAILYFARQWRNNQAAQLKQQQMQQSMPSTEMSTSLLSAAHPPASAEHIQV